MGDYNFIKLKQINTKLVIFICFFIYSNFTISQNTINNYNKDYYNWFDGVVGIENTGLFNGSIYKEKYITKNGNHKFYLTSKFKNGTILYNNQTYYDIELKYDIYEDVLIIQLPGNSEYSFIQLINDLLNGFIIDNHNFIKISEKTDEFYKATLHGFYEISHPNKTLKLLTKHKKSRKEHIGNVVYSQFKEANEFFVFTNNKYYNIKSKKNIKKLMPKFEKNIDHFYTQNKQLFKSQNNVFMHNLVEYLNNLLTTSGELY